MFLDLLTKLSLCQICRAKSYVVGFTFHLAKIVYPENKSLRNIPDMNIVPAEMFFKKSDWFGVRNDELQFETTN